MAHMTMAKRNISYQFSKWEVTQILDFVPIPCYWLISILSARSVFGPRVTFASDLWLHESDSKLFLCTTQKTLFSDTDPKKKTALSRDQILASKVLVEQKHKKTSFVTMWQLGFLVLKENAKFYNTMFYKPSNRSSNQLKSRYCKLNQCSDIYRSVETSTKVYYNVYTYFLWT